MKGRYLLAIIVSLWPLFLINEFGIGLVAIIIINFWIGMSLGEAAERLGL